MRKLCMIIMGMILFLTGCSVEKMDQNKLRDLDFEILEASQVPEALQTLIEEKKQTEMKITFDTEDSKYIVVGYGTQETGGYSISVEELYESSNAVYIDTNLIGPAKGEAVNKSQSYPYIIVKIANIDKSVVFE